MITEEMIENAAKAIAFAGRHHTDISADAEVFWKYTSEGGRARYRTMANAAFALLPGEPATEPYGYAFQHEETGQQQVVDVQQVEWGFEENNPRWQKLGAVYLHPPVQTADFADYDAGLLNNFGAGNIEWWQDYVRAEIGRANDFWREQVSSASPTPHPNLDREGLLEEARRVIELAEGRLSLLLSAYPDESETCDHPIATRYVRERVAAFLSKLEGSSNAKA